MMQNEVCANYIDRPVADFISELKGKKIKLWVEGEKLCYKAPKGVVTAKTVKELSERKQALIDYLRGSDDIFYEPIEQVEKKEYYPLSAAQQRMFVLNQMDKESTAYNLTQVFKIEGGFDRDRLAEVIGKLIERHEALRTSYVLKDGKAVQKICDKINFQLDYAELDGDSWQPDKEIDGFVRPYDLSEPPLFRIKLLKINQTDKQDTYFMLYDMHHIISDGISEAIMVNEINMLYAKKQLPELKIHYKDYADWQRKRLLSGYRMEAQKKYWLDQFQNEIPILNLPGDFPRPSMFSYRGEGIKQQINMELTDKLRGLARENKVTLFTVLLSAYNVLLSRYTGQTDIVVGTPTGGRRHADANNLIGIFVNTLALRQYPEPEKTFSDFMKEVGANVIKAFDNQDYPFEQLVDILNIKRDLGRNPVFDTMLILQNMRVADVSADGLKIERYDCPKKSVQFDMTVIATENSNGIEIEADYYSGLFKRETAERFLRHYINILEKSAENPDGRLCEIDMLSEAEKNRLLFEYNNTRAWYPKKKTIQELFEEQAGKTPDNTAAVFKEKCLTYAELNQKANQLAKILRTKGVKADSIVGIMVERSLEMLIGILGVLKAGGAYLPLDPEYPADRIQYMLRDSGAKMLLSQPCFVEKTVYPYEFIDLTDEKLYSGEGLNLKPANTAENLAYVIYTSGSTGNPKGVMLMHKSVNNFIKGVTDRIEFHEGDTILALTTISFDIFVLETLLPLTRGLKVVIADENQQRDPGELSRLIAGSGIDMLQLTPSRLRLLLASGKGLESLKKIKKLMIGGETMPKDLMTALSALSSQKIYNMYGPTETTVWSTIKELNGCNDINIGKPISNTQIYILDKNKNPQPQGVAGELCIAGDGLAAGYLNRPELTREKFIQNPFDKGTKMYRTGDLAVWLPNGEINCLGRVDYQVKIRGFRIEMGEIESRLLEHEAVKEAVVTDKIGKNGEKYLCAYIVPGRELKVQELSEFLSKDLPYYMIPSCFVRLEKMPLTANGKINRRALPEPDESTMISSAYVSPENDIEKKLAAIWAEVLQNGKTKKIGVNDSFFDIGGNSLLAVNVHSMLRKEYGDHIKVTDLFIYPTIKKMADYIRSFKDQAVSNIELAFLSLPEEYFINGCGNDAGSAFNFNIDYELRDKINGIGNSLDVKPETVFVAMYMYLFYEITEQSEITVYTITDVQNTIVPVTVNFDEINSIPDLICAAQEKKVSGIKSNAWQIKKNFGGVSAVKEKNSVALLICSRNLLTESTVPTDAFDIILEIDRVNGNFNFTFGYKGNRLDKTGMKKIALGYIEMLKVLVKDYK